MLLDTDILVDAALNREPFSGPTSELLDLLGRSEQRAYVAWHTVSNLYYILYRSEGDAVARQYILGHLRIVYVAQTGTEDLLYAASLPMRDFEDAMQVAAARACGARHIVTRNTRDYARSPIPAISPQEALSQLL